jgi:hypothetical protein
MHRQPIQLTFKQSLTLLILSIVTIILVTVTYKTPIEQLKANMVSVFVEHDSSVKGSNLLMAKIVTSSKNPDLCAKVFNEVVIPGTDMLGDGTIRTNKQIMDGIEILIMAIEMRCK